MFKAFVCKLALAAVAVVTLVAAIPARAADIDYTADRANSSTSANIFANFPRGGQSFIIPAGETRLYAVTLFAESVGNPSLGTLSLHALTGSTPGPALASVAYESDGTTTTRVLTIPGGVAVTPGGSYVILANFTSGSPLRIPHRADIYPDGSLYQENNGPLRTDRDAYFKVSFDPASAPAPVPVPTLAQWAVILLGLVLAGGAALHIQRRRFAT